MKINNIVKSAVIASIYAVISLALAPISFGVAQFRIAESLTILPIFGKLPIYGLTVGVFLTNLIGVFLGVNIAGTLDIFIGTLATLIAALMTYWFRNVKTFKLPLLSILPPIVINAIFIGAELTFVVTGSFTFGAFILIGLQIMLEQTLALALGLFLYKTLLKTGLYKKFIED
ncbi:MAG: QueT transporter family protein [Oscillospiraceae bacterium]